ncbi:Protein of unknown function (DUF3052) [Erythrobacter litoralis]|jgi:hypothetical protein|uniref:DUF3052 domain-containing protein n=1 Tax=Erythrobacter litoralis TaxID=39960 RepID=A0A074MV07_9SPHN|nr:DUF3052 family protein [Erythrobacter litoralis]AOL23655.1 Protein of unknown function (DUF3052) [Erythrobacter litoralis]KEO98861.1 hypothetical protein EH32_07080 [Erythrobacter litoralis]MEE4338572.1 DUF3052 family protein [Erythrobacter sp.]
MSAGHSGTPLARKLNLRDGQRCWFEGMPDHVQDEIDEYALDLVFVADPAEGIDAAHIFVTDGAHLSARLSRLKGQIASDGQIWVSFPNGESASETALDEAQVQRIGVELGLVDTKKCALDDIWSSVKFVIAKADR